MVGLGTTRLLNYQIVELLRTGQLKIVLGKYESPLVPVYILHREGRHSSAKIRTFVDLMATRLRAELSLT